MTPTPAPKFKVGDFFRDKDNTPYVITRIMHDGTIVAYDVRLAKNFKEGDLYHA